MPSALPAQPPSTVAAPPPASTKVTTSPAPVSAPVAAFPSPVAPSRLTLAPIPVSATLAANEALARKRRAGETVLPLAFGEAGLPAHPLLIQALANLLKVQAWPLSSEAERWRTERWDSLRFQLPNRWLELPGKPYAGTDPNGFTHHSDVLRFIVDYAAEIAAPVRTGVEVTSLSADEGSGGYSLETTDGQINARHVVIATGPFQRPMIPDYSQAVPSCVYQRDATHYRNPVELPPGAVLIIGTGNSGCQIADELLRSGRHVFLAVSRHSRAPRRYRGKDVIWWYENLGRFDVNVDTFPGRRYPPRRCGLRSSPTR